MSNILHTLAGLFALCSTVVFALIFVVAKTAGDTAIMFTSVIAVPTFLVLAVLAFREVGHV